MVGFIFGGNTGLSYDQLQQKRKLADALAAQVLGSTPKTTAEGIGAVMKGIGAGVGRYRANKGLTAGSEDANSAYDSIFSKLMGGGSGNTPAQVGNGGQTIPNPSGSDISLTPSKPIDMSGNEIFSDFIGTVKQGGVQNPYALAAVAATGKAESGYDPGNVNRSWSDPSESGKAGTAGGIMSWRGPRLASLQAYASSKGEQGNGSPKTQAEFLLQEDPNLIAKLNNAGSVEEAQQLMNNAWAFKGYNRPGGESARRMGLASSFLPTFQGQGGGQQVASLDPSAGMPRQGAAAAIEQAAPGSGYVDPQVTTANRMPAPQQRPQQMGPQMPPQQMASAQPQSGAGDALPPLPSSNVAPAPQVAAVPSVAPQEAQPSMPQPQQVAQANPFGGVDPGLLKLLSNPFLDEDKKAAVRLVVQQQMQAAENAQQESTWRAREDYKLSAQKADPSYQLDQDYKRAQLEALKNKTGNPNLINAGEGNIYDPDTKTWIKAPSAQGQTGEGFRFGGNSVEAQALNGLIDSKQLTAAQAQQLAAGKQVTGPNGEILFMTPQGIFSQPGQGGNAPAPQQDEGVNLFGDQQPIPNQQPALAPSPQSNVPAAQQGAIQLTGPKAPNEGQANAGGFADRMQNAEATIGQFENQGADFWQQMGAKAPGGNYMVSPEYQRYDRAKRDFINAQLRKESGAVIGADEFRNADVQYFPQPGDGPDVIEDKRRARELARQGMTRSAGPSYHANPAENPLPPTPKPQDGVARPASKAEFDALPSGTEFIAPDGSRRRKP